MNREQAGHLLDAYVRMMMRNPDEATDALREVILDAMTSYRVQSVPSVTVPNIVPGTTHPAVGNQNIVTCETGGAL